MLVEIADSLPPPVVTGPPEDVTTDTGALGAGAGRETTLAGGVNNCCGIGVRLTGSGVALGGIFKFDNKVTYKKK